MSVDQLGTTNTNDATQDAQRMAPSAPTPATPTADPATLQAAATGGVATATQAPAAAAPANDPNKPHPLASALNAVLKSATGGNVTYIDQNGKQQVAPQSSMTLGKTLIAATLAGLLSKDDYRQTAYGPVRDYAGTAGNAAEASQKVLQDARNKPQQISDEQVAAQSRRLLTLQNNAKLVEMQAASAHQQHVTLQDNLANSQAFLAPINEYDSNRAHDQPSAYLQKGLTAEQVTAPNSGIKLTDSNVVLDGSRTVYNPETQQNEEHPLYSVLNPALKDIALPKEVTDKLNEINSQWSDIHKVVGQDVRVPVNAYVSAMHEYQTVTQSQHILDTLNQEVNGDKAQAVALAPAIRANRQLLQTLSVMQQAVAAGNTAGTRPDNVLDAILKAPNGGEILKLIGLTPQQADQKMQDINNKRISAAKLAEQGGIGDKSPAPADTVAALRKNINALPPSDASNLMTDIPSNGQMNMGQVEKLTGRIDATVKTNKENAQKQANQANPDDVDVLSDQLLQPNNLTAMKDIGGRGNQRTQILAAAARKAKERGIPFDIGLVNQRTKFLGEYEDPKGRAATNRQAINNVLQHAGDLSDLNQANRRADVKIVNTPINELKDQFGDQTYTQYQTASGVLKDELSLYFAGGYAPSKDQQEMWNKIQSDTATPSQTEAFAKEVVRLASRRANTFNQQFKTNMGYDDPNMITPAAKAAAEHLGMGNEVSQFGSGGQLGQRGGQYSPNNPFAKTKAGQ